MANDLPAELLYRAQRGDRVAQRAFLESVAGSIRVLLRRLGGSMERDDVVQDIYAKLLEVLPRYRFDGRASLNTWVHSVVHRWLLEQHRRRKLSVIPLDAGLGVADQRPAPDDQASSSQLASRLEAAIAQLPEEQRRVIVFTQLHQEPLEVFAEVEGVPIGTVKSRLHRARAALFLMLEEPEGGARAAAGGR